MKVSLIITTYNRPDALETVLGSVQGQRRLPDEIIIVDDGSNDRTADVIGQFKPALPRLQHLWEKHDGFRPARMRNWGILAATGEYIVLIDGDMALDPRFIGDHIDNAHQGRYLQGVRIPLTERATAAYLKQPFAVRPQHVGGLTKAKYLVRNKLLSRALTSRPHNSLTRIHSCNQSFWRDDLLEVNGFDERYNNGGGEDIDMCARLNSIGVLQVRLKFLALAYHLYHPRCANWSQVLSLPRASEWAELGIDQLRPRLRRYTPTRAAASFDPVRHLRRAA